MKTRIGSRNLAVGGIWLMAQSLSAAVITVTTFSDGIDGDKECSLREAIVAANSDAASEACSAGSGLDTIVLAAGTYTLDLVSDGDLDILADVEILGQGSGLTAISGGVGWGERIFDIADGIESLFWGLTVSGGRDPSDVGGGFRSLGHLELVDVVVTDNEAEFAGGGVAIEESGSAVLVDTRVTANRINTGGEGPGLYLTGPAAFFNVEVSDHSCDDCNGAGVWLRSSEFLWHGGEAARNHAAAVSGATVGGAMLLSGQSGAGPVLFSLEDLWVHHNSADLGGAISFAGDESTLQISNSTLEANAAVAGFNGLGGALRVSGGSTELVNVTLSGNEADEDGGGAYIDFNAAFSARYVTITANRANTDGMFAGVGGGLGVASGTLGPVILEATILDGNLVGASATATGSQCSDREGGLVASAGYNLQSVYQMGHPLSCNLASTGDQQGTEMSPLDSGIDPVLADNGGATQTHALLAGSPVLDAIPVGQAGCRVEITLDQRGATRAGGSGVGGSGCDSGSFEGESTPGIFSDGFESGYTQAWSSTSSQPER